MPTSHDFCDPLFLYDVRNTIKPQTCFDVGVGYGKTGSLIKQVAPNCRISGFEIHQQYIDDRKEHLETLYDSIIAADFYEWMQKNVDWKVDLIVFGDVLEHFLKSRALDILDVSIYRSKWIVIKAPVSYCQESHEGNIFEAHLSNILLKDLASYNIIHYAKVQFMTYYLIKGLLP